MQCVRYTHGQCGVSHYCSVQKLNGLVLSALEQDGKVSAALTEKLRQAAVPEEEKNRLLCAPVQKIIFFRSDCSVRIQYK